MQDQTEVGRAKRKVVTFLVVLALLSVPGYLVAFTSSPTIGLPAALAMPAVAGLLTRLIFQKNLSGVGWKRGRFRYYPLAYVLPVIWLVIAHAIMWSTAIADISVEAFVAYVTEMTNGSFDTLLSGLFAVAFISVPFTTILVLQEELGWRGLLVPELAKFTSFTTNCLITTLIWAVYHFPLIVGFGYISGSAPMWYKLVTAVLFLIPVTVIVNWLRLRSGSIWPPSLLHASGNAFMGNLFAPLTVAGSNFDYWGGAAGLMIFLVTAAVAYLFWLRRSELEGESY